MVYLAGRRKKNRRTTSDIYGKLRDIVTAEAELPKEIQINNPAAWDVWVIWQATGKKFLPSEILAEPEALLADMLTLDSAYEAIKEASKPKEQ